MKIKTIYDDMKNIMTAITRISKRNKATEMLRKIKVSKFNCQDRDYSPAMFIEAQKLRCLVREG